MTTERPQTIRQKARVVRGVLCMVALLLAMVLSGCVILGYLPPEKLPYAKLSVPYDSTQLKTGTTLDVLNVARSPAYQFDHDKVEQVLLTQSSTTIAYSGRSEDGRKTWLNVIVFDEYRLTAKRKYLFIVDEQAEISPTTPKHYLIPPRRGIIFDSQFVIDPDILTTPYATEEAQKVKIIQWLAEQFRSDIASLLGNPQDPVRGSALISMSGMMMNQTFTGLLIELDKSPGLAGDLSAERGIEFPHISLNKGRVRLLVQDDIGDMKMRVNLPMTPLPE